MDIMEQTVKGEPTTPRLALAASIVVYPHDIGVPSPHGALALAATNAVWKALRLDLGLQRRLGCTLRSISGGRRCGRRCATRQPTRRSGRARCSGPHSCSSVRCHDVAAIWVAFPPSHSSRDDNDIVADRPRRHRGRRDLPRAVAGACDDLARSVLHGLGIPRLQLRAAYRHAPRRRDRCDTYSATLSY